MIGFSFKTVLFYAAYLCLAARAAPVTTLSPIPTTTDAGSAMMTTVAPEGDGPVVPPFQCSTQNITAYRRSVSSLYEGFTLATDYINNEVLTPGECSPLETRLSIFHRVEAEVNTFSLSQGFAIFQVYSKIAHFASQNDSVSEADQAKMQIVHDLLNSLITNYYEVVTPDHCSCGSASSGSCVTIPSYDFLQLETYPDSCSPAAYVSTNLVNEFERVLLKFIDSPILHDNIYFVESTSCQQWKNDYLPPNSSAASALPCQS